MWHLISTLNYANRFWRFADEAECDTTRRCEEALAAGFMKRHSWPWTDKTVIQYTTTAAGIKELKRLRAVADEKWKMVQERLANHSALCDKIGDEAENPR